MSLLFNMLSRLVIAFLPRSKCLLISWLQSPSAVILEPRKIKSVTVSIVSPFIYHEVMGLGAMILVFWMLSFKPTSSLSSFKFIKKLLTSLLYATKVVSSAYLWLLIFLLAILIPACASSSQTFIMMYLAGTLLHWDWHPDHSGYSGASLPAKGLDPAATTGTLLSLVSSWHGQLARVPCPVRNRFYWPLSSSLSFSSP